MQDNSNQLSIYKAHSEHRNSISRSAVSCVVVTTHSSVSLLTCADYRASVWLFTYLALGCVLSYVCCAVPSGDEAAAWCPSADHDCGTFAVAIHCANCAFVLTI